MEHHSSHRTWTFPSARPDLGGGLLRVNLRELAARPARFEHHLSVVARGGSGQLEFATASEPLYFAHQNISDEHVIALSTGDRLLDTFAFRVFISDPASGTDVARVRHRVHDRVLHPEGYLHWPGRLRPPYEAPGFPDGQRRAVLSLVFCGREPCPSSDPADRVGEGRDADAKAYVEPHPPLHLEALSQKPLGVVARVGDATLSKRALPYEPERGGYLLVLEAEPGEGAFATDLVYVPPGSRYDDPSVTLALAFESARGVEPPPELLRRAPDEPFPRFEGAEPGALPLTIQGWRFDAVDERTLSVQPEGGAPVEVPRYWLARMLYRVALHTMVLDCDRVALPEPRLGYVETYGGLFYDDRGERFRIGVRDRGAIAIPREAMAETLERLYRAVAPPGYREDL